MIKACQQGDSRSSSIRVLHVDDERRFIEITRLFLQREGYTNFKIAPVLSAEQTLERLEEETFDVVISDYKMPGMNGLEFLEEVRKKGNEIPFIILTGKGEESVAMDAVNKGASRYVTKKVGNPKVLFDTLKQYILEVVEERKEEKEREELIKEVEARGKEHPLILALKDKDWNVRMCAAEALGKIGDTRAIEPLIHALKDKKGNVRESAAEALGKIGEPAVEPLIHAMDAEEENVRLGAAWALGEIRDGRAIESLISALIDENLDIQWSAAEALVKIRDKRAVEPLIHVLEDEMESVRWCSAEVLGEIGDKRAVEPLIQASKVENEDVRKAAENALEKIQRRKEEMHEGESDLAKQMADLRNTVFKRLDLRKTVVEQPDKKERSEVEEVKLKPEQIKEIRDLHARGYRDFDIAKRMGIPKKGVTKQLEEERARRLEDAYTPSR
nr:HEAT repeat domain-containing protein [Methanomicrobia archaeon]